MTRLLCIALLAAVQAAICAAEPVPWRIDLVQWRGETDAERGFRERIGEHGHPVTWRIHDCKLDAGKGREIAAAIAADPPDLVYVATTNGALAVAGRMDQPGPLPASLPIVFAVVGDPVGSGLIARLDAPGRAMTGVIHLIPAERQVTVLSAALPQRRVAVLVVDGSVPARLQRAALAVPAAANGWALIDHALPAKPDAAAIAAAIAAFKAANADALYLPSDSVLIAQAKPIVAAAHAAGLPVWSAAEGPVRDAGALIGVVGRYRAVGRFAAAKALAILAEGKAATSIPSEPLPSYGVVVSGKAAAALGWPDIGVLKVAEIIP